MTDSEKVELAIAHERDGWQWLVAKWLVYPDELGEMYEELLAVRQGLEESSHKYTIMILNEVLTHLKNYVV